MGPTDRTAPPDDRATALEAERDAALERVRELEHELGRLRGQVHRLEVLSVWRRTWRRVATAVPYRAGRLLRR